MRLASEKQGHLQVTATVDDAADKDVAVIGDPVENNEVRWNWKRPDAWTEVGTQPSSVWENA